MGRKVTITVISGDENHIINKVNVFDGELGKRLRRFPFGEQTTLDMISSGEFEGNEFVVVLTEEEEWAFEGSERELIELASKAEEV